jgi:uncharacterized protein (DUF924 family)
LFAVLQFLFFDLTPRIKSYFGDPNYDDSPDYAKLLAYWFGGNPYSCDYSERPDMWFCSGQAQLELDHYISDSYSDLHARELNDELVGDWRETARGNLARIILLDQFSRHIYRGMPKMFEYDARSSAIALEMIENGSYLELAPVERNFVCIALEHTENLKNLELCVKLSEANVNVSPLEQRSVMEDHILVAKSHLDQITLFGRYPYRNDLLGRESTKEEKEYLRTHNINYMNSIYKSNVETKFKEILED